MTIHGRYGFHDGTNGCPRTWTELGPKAALVGFAMHRLCQVCGAIKTPLRTIRTVAPEYRR